MNELTAPTNNKKTTSKHIASTTTTTTTIYAPMRIKVEKRENSEERKEV